MEPQAGDDYFQKLTLQAASNTLPDVFWIHDQGIKGFAEKGITGYRIVESVGATEGAPAIGTAEFIVDITTSGATLKANQLKILDDGLILASCAVFAARKNTVNDSQMLNLIALLKRAIVG